MSDVLSPWSEREVAKAEQGSLADGECGNCN